MSEFKTVPASEYTREYYTTGCDGYNEFRETGGEALRGRLSVPFEIAEVQPGMTVLDVGCGRGELVLHCARLGAQVWGQDYAIEALKLSKEILPGDTPADLTAVQLSDATKLPFVSNSVDRVFMLDVVEHLYPPQLSAAFDEIYRVLKPGGKLVIHTMPNLWYYWYGYPIFRLVQLLRGNPIPANPRDRWEFAHVHVNEQTPTRLRKALRGSSFKTKVWLQNVQPFDRESSRFMKLGMGILVKAWPVKRIFCNDIFAVGTK